jgi:hypothetical protein
MNRRDFMNLLWLPIIIHQDDSAMKPPAIGNWTEFDLEPGWYHAPGFGRVAFHYNESRQTQLKGVAERVFEYPTKDVTPDIGYVFCVPGGYKPKENILVTWNKYPVVIRTDGWVVVDFGGTMPVGKVQISFDPIAFQPW